MFWYSIFCAPAGLIQALAATNPAYVYECFCNGTTRTGIEDRLKVGAGRHPPRFVPLYTAVFPRLGSVTI